MSKLYGAFEQPLGEWVIERMQRNIPIHSVWDRERCLTEAPNLEGNSTICRYSSLEQNFQQSEVKFHD